MNAKEYVDLFKEILERKYTSPPYDQEGYLNYTQLNSNRQNRWLKSGHINDEIKHKIINFKAPQQWIIITEPWCGDAAHSVPFMIKLAELNDNIQLDIQLRDQPPFLIDQYLTNGTSKSIPILVVRDEEGEDIFTWGPRPKECQKVLDELKKENVDFEAQNLALQNWYNENKGVDIQKELLELMEKNAL